MLMSRTDALQLVRGVDLVNGGALADELVFEPCEELGQGRAVANVTRAHALEFDVVLDRLGVADGTSHFLHVPFTPETLVEGP